MENKVILNQGQTQDFDLSIVLLFKISGKLGRSRWGKKRNIIC